MDRMEEDEFCSRLEVLCGVTGTAWEPLSYVPNVLPCSLISLQPSLAPGTS